jgi:hypothetical protein
MTLIIQKPTGAKLVMGQTSYPDIRNGIVTNGLVLNLDAGQTASYPGTGTAWSDLSGNGNNGTLNGGVAYNSGNQGYLIFDNSNDYVSTTYQFPTGSLPKSFSVWFKPDTSTDRGWIISGGLNDLAQAFGLFQIGGMGQLFFHGNGAAADLTLNVVLNPAQWYNAAITYDGTTVSAYINGQLDNSKNVALNTGGSTVVFGARQGFAAIEFFDGNISQALFYNRALSAAEIQQNFNCLRMRYGI